MQRLAKHLAQDLEGSDKEFGLYSETSGRL